MSITKKGFEVKATTVFEK